MKKSLLIVLFASIVSVSYSQQTAEEFNDMAGKKMELKDYQYATVLINKAIALDKKNQWYLLRKADIQFSLTGPVDAIITAKAAIALDKKIAEPYNRLASYYDSGGMGDSAVMMYNEAINRAENDTAKNSYIMNRGTAKLGMRDFAGAVKDFEITLAFDPSNIGALNNISSGYAELGMTNKSIASLEKIIKLDPTFIGPYINLGFTYSDLDSLDLALKYFNKAVEMDPKEPLVYNNRGYVYYKKGDYASALADINYSIKMYPTNSYAYRNLALVYIAMKKMEEACTTLDYAREYGFEKRYGPEVEDLIKKYCK
jgi:tetratricopeptide (TPR) repeat protein